MPIHSIVKEICLSDYRHEQLFATTGALFDINEVLLAIGEQTAPEYHAGCVTGPDPDSSGEALLQSFNAGEITLDELQESYRIINRLDNNLRKAGHTL